MFEPEDNAAILDAGDRFSIDRNDRLKRLAAGDRVNREDERRGLVLGHLEHPGDPAGARVPLVRPDEDPHHKNSGRVGPAITPRKLAGGRSKMCLIIRIAVSCGVKMPPVHDHSPVARCVTK
jgi:hypothetical protein